MPKLLVFGFWARLLMSTYDLEESCKFRVSSKRSNSTIFNSDVNWSFESLYGLNSVKLGFDRALSRYSLDK